MQTAYRIGSWRFDPDEPLLRGEKGERRLEDRTARTLELLCARRGRVVSKDELIAVVWNNRAVSSNSVAIVIGDLRRALGDDPRAPNHILTVPKRGYRLAGAPDQEPPRSALPTVPPVPAVPDIGHRSSGRMWLAAAAVAVCVLGAVAAVAPSPPGVELLVDPVRNDTGRNSLDPLAASLGTVVVERASRLIPWNGAPELALTVIDRATNAVVWSAFA